LTQQWAGRIGGPPFSDRTDQESQMDTTATGPAAARQTGRRKVSQRRELRWTLVAASLVIVTGLGGGAAVADEDEMEHSVAARLAPRSLMLDAVALDGRLVAVGERGHILISTDAGASWQQVDVPTRALLTGVAFTSQEVGIAVGHDSVILRTFDGGATWSRVHWAPEDEAPFFDVWFTDADNGVAIGAYGSHFRTTDGGVTWDFEPIGDTDWHLHEIARSDNGKLYLAAEAGFVYRSDDGGATWTELPSPYEGSFFGVLPLDGDSVLLYGLRGHLFRSDDAGETWAELDTGTVAMLTNGIRLADGTIVIVGLGGTVLVSTDGGQSFSYSQQPGRRGISTIVETADGSLLLAGEFGLRIATLAELTAGGE
jgi:photosystem II stability/assembly factor-like uncharacterized protein